MSRDYKNNFYPRFWSKVCVKSKKVCWEWSGSISPNGYGKFSIKNHPHSAHVLSYKFYHDDHDSSLCIDHICMNKKCVNPWHLRQVTRKVNNTENTDGVGARNKVKTKCAKGHKYTNENTRIKIVRGNESRVCRICERLWRKKCPSYGDNSKRAALNKLKKTKICEHAKY